MSNKCSSASDGQADAAVEISTYQCVATKRMNMITSRTEILEAIVSSAANALFPMLIIAAFVIIGLFLFKKLSEDEEKELGQSNQNS